MAFKFQLRPTSKATVAPEPGIERFAWRDDRTTIDVAGMTCQNCVGHVTDELTAVGARNVAVELQSGGVSKVSFDAATAPSAAAVREAIDEAGYEIVGPTATVIPADA